MADFAAAALTAARNYCGWHVTPVEDTTVTVDGPGGPLLSLPTLRLVEVTAISEDGNTLDTDDLVVSPLGLLRKRSRGSWSRNYGAIEVTMSHGYETAEDFTVAVETITKAMQSAGLRDDPSLIEKQVDDVRYKWSDRDTDLAAGYLLAGYRLEKPA
jgi:hypothetical protein